MVDRIRTDEAIHVAYLQLVLLHGRIRAHADGKRLVGELEAHAAA